MIVWRSLVEERDSIPNSLARKHQEYVLSHRGSNAQTIQFQVIGEREFQVLQGKEGRGGESLRNQGVHFFGQPLLHGFRQPSLVVDKPLQILVTEPTEQTSVDVQGSAEVFSSRVSSFSKRIRLIALQPLIGPEDDVQMPPGRHGELLTKLGVDFVVGELHECVP